MELELILAITSQFAGNFSFQASFCTPLINVKLPLTSALEAKGDQHLVKGSRTWLLRRRQDRLAQFPDTFIFHFKMIRETRTESVEKIDRFGYVCTAFLNLFFVRHLGVAVKFSLCPIQNEKNFSNKSHFHSILAHLLPHPLKYSFFSRFTEGFQALKVRVR